MKDVTRYVGSDAEKRAKAIEDVKSFLGEDRYNLLIEGCKGMGFIQFEAFRTMLCFAGVRGYPVKVLHEQIYS